MPRNGSGVYSLPPGSIVANGEDTDASQHNTPLLDLASDANSPRPIAAGGTGANSVAQARTNLGLGAVALDNIVPIARGGTGATTVALARASLGLSTVAATGAYSDLSGLPTIPSAPSNLTQEQAEDDASTDFGLVSGQRIAQAITAFDPALRPPDYAATVAGAFPAANATVRLTHGLGAKPRRFEFYAICLSASNGHAAGDELTISSDYSQVVSTAVTATEVKLLMRNSIFFSTEDSSATFSPHGNSDWQLGVRAWR